MKQKLIYGCLLVVTLWLAASGKNPFALPLLGLLLAVPLLSAGCCAALRKSIVPRLVEPTRSYAVGEAFTIELELKNRGKLPAPAVRAALVCKDGFSGQDAALRGVAMVDGGGRARLRFTLTQSHCGALTVSLASLEGEDWFGLSRAVFPVDIPPITLHILPTPLPGTGLTIPGGDSLEGVAALLRAAPLGEDYDLRPYRVGDPLHQVHWKMTAKTDQLTVRSYLEGGGRQVCLIVDPGTPRLERQEWDRFAGQVSGVSRRLLELGCPHLTVWREEVSQREAVFAVAGERERDSMVRALMELPTPDGLGIAPWEKEYYRNEAKEIVLRLGWTAEEGTVAPAAAGAV